MLQTLAGFAAVGAVGLVALPALSAWLKRGSSNAQTEATPTVRDANSNAQTEATPTVREELRRIWNKEDVPDVMPKGVRSANRLSTADQLDDSRFDSGSHSDVGSADDGE
jgi:hypothetical protein